jgi:ATP adenylyltransferase
VPPAAADFPEAAIAAESQLSGAGVPDADTRAPDADTRAPDADTRVPDADTGVPDAFERLWTPHRLAYIKGAGKPTGPGAHEGCPFCIAPTLSDEDGLIVARGELVYSIMNLYPYNSGHMLICPYRHLADYTELTREETAEFSDYTTRAISALRTVSGPHGFNIGMNLGTVAGAGIAAHLHQHVVPRWGGDTNFMPVVGRTRVLPQLLADTRKLLADAWPQEPAE